MSCVNYFVDLCILQNMREEPSVIKKKDVI